MSTVGHGPQLLILDASTLINVIDVLEWESLFKLSGFTWATTPAIVSQVTVKQHRVRPMRDALSDARLRIVDEEIPPDLLVWFVDTAKRLGEADASLIVNSIVLGAGLAADDGALRKAAVRKGVSPILGTEELLAEMVTQGEITIGRGNRRINKLKEYRFRPRVKCLCELCGLECRCRHVAP